MNEHHQDINVLVDAVRTVMDKIKNTSKLRFLIFLAFVLFCFVLFCFVLFCFVLFTDFFCFVWLFCFREYLRSIQEKASAKILGPVLPVETRWGSTHKVLERFLEIHPSVEKMAIMGFFDSLEVSWPDYVSVKELCKVPSFLFLLFSFFF